MTGSPNSHPLSFLKAITLQSSESDIEIKVVIPLLRILGYGDGDWRSQARFAKIKLDFLVHPNELFTTCLPYLVIEVKAANKNIDSAVWQINNYMRQSRATLGLLTNGYKFRLLYNHQGQVVTIFNYSQTEFISQFNLPYKILCKETCLKVGNAVLQSQNNINLQFLNHIAKAFASEDMFGLFKKKPNSDGDSELRPESNAVNSQKRKSMIITVFNNKGGVGKTTTTINLAAALSKLGKRVLLIDIDAQANLSMGLGIDPLNDVEFAGKKDVVDLLINPRTLLKDTVLSKKWDDVQIDIIPSHIRLSEKESDINSLINRDLVLAQKLNNAKYFYGDNYDFVLIDPPPSFGVVNNISLMASSAILIPTQLAPYPIRALEYVVKRAKAVGESRPDPLPILGIAVSMYDRNASKFNLSMTEQIEQILSREGVGEGVNLFPDKTWIPRLNIVAAATSLKKEYPLCYAEFDSDLNARDKESAQDAFSCYMELAKHTVEVTEGI
ncbi:MAG: AAA family ATPase [Leptolyngbyaceae cyanobacterium RM2_2_4]|nr:AAA family ATPase [Leptolyngbyaceae cyanobacterium SM1_4_3]NJN89882.1 AAA family ATPase [Leptolyngbyaceae cyanobacterium SL_5_14]NJO48735.1 AAA family ATPase [Leptolyngbyaceae cyanobacterium RM2_2_4]